MDKTNLIDLLREYGVSRRKLDDELFAGEIVIARLGIFDADEGTSIHVVVTPCNIPGCNFTATSVQEYENHYNASHRYTCSQCKKLLPTPHLLDLHIQETHDSFFAVMAAKKPSYNCYIEECKEKFMNIEDRLNHCVEFHKLPKDFRFDLKPKSSKQAKNKKPLKNTIEVHNKQEVVFTNSKTKTFSKYNGKKFTEKNNVRHDVNIDRVMDDLKDNLPE